MNGVAVNVLKRIDNITVKPGFISIIDIDLLTLPYKS